MARASYQRDIPGRLHVHLDNGEKWVATAEDLEKFNLVDRHAAYALFEEMLTEVLTKAGLIEGDITDAQLNAVRYLAETAIVHPHLLEHREHNAWAKVVEIERVLQDSALLDAHRQPAEKG